MDNEAKEGSWKPVVIVLLISLGIAFFWDSFPFIKNSIHAIFDPSIGPLLDWNLTYGFLLLIIILNLVMTLVQKYTTDQETLKELKKKQKESQKDMKKYRDHPEKMMALQKEVFPDTIKMMKLSMRSMVYVGVPLILLFRWFLDIFTTLGNPKLLFGLTWFWFYLIFSMISNGIFRKILKVV